MVRRVHADVANTMNCTRCRLILDKDVPLVVTVENPHLTRCENGHERPLPVRRSCVSCRFWSDGCQHRIVAEMGPLDRHMFSCSLWESQP